VVAAADFPWQEKPSNEAKVATFILKKKSARNEQKSEDEL
jgi:hypothetical protein